MKKKGIPEIFVRSVVCLYEGAKTQVGMDSELSEVEVRMYQGCVLLPFIFLVVIDVVTELVREGVLGELLYADDLLLMSKTIEGLRRVKKWKVFESKCWEVNLWKANVMVNESITKDGLSNGKVDPWWVCCLRVKAYPVLCVQWIHSRCAGVKMVTQKF